MAYSAGWGPSWGELDGCWCTCVGQHVAVAEGYSPSGASMASKAEKYSHLLRRRLSAGIIATRSRPEIHARCRVEMVSKRVEKNAMMEILRMVMVVHKCVQLRLALIVYP